MLGNNSRLPNCLYTSSEIGKPDDTQKHIFRGLGDVDCWLELAIDSMNIDGNIGKSDGKKKNCMFPTSIDLGANISFIY